MATILEFPSVTTPPQRARVRAAAPVAEIVIFPGVRYERMDTPSSSAERKSAVERDRLTLLD